MLLQLLAKLRLSRPQVYLVHDPLTKKSSMILKLKLWSGVSLMMTVMLVQHRPTISLQLVTKLPGGFQLTSPARLLRAT